MTKINYDFNYLLPCCSLIFHLDLTIRPLLLMLFNVSAGIAESPPDDDPPFPRLLDDDSGI